jgi:transposase
LRKLGHTQEFVAQHIGCSTKAVSKWEGRYEQSGNFKVAESKKRGRPRVTTEETDTSIVMASTIDHFDTPRRLKQRLGLDISTDTIDRRLVEAGLPGRVAQHQKIYSAEEKRKRLSFAEGYKNWSEKDWERVLFSDEKKFYGAGFCGRVWVRRPPGMALNEEYIVDRKPHPVNVNAWGCFSSGGLGYLYIFNQTLDAKLLKTIYDTHLLSSSQLVFPEDPPQQWWLLADNDPKHNSRLAINWLHNNGISCLEFPTYSPDLNPIENLWADVARRVEVRDVSTMEKLQDVVAEEWAATDKQLLTKLAHSMPKRCREVIEAKGDHINY